MFYIKIKTLDEQFIFDWEKCNHRAVLYDKVDVSRYKLEQVDTGNLGVPYYHDMKLQKMVMPKKIAAWKIAVIVVLGLALGVLLAMLLDRLGLPFVP
ncbi:MAG TPA: hypothetical protein VGJ22_02880 [Anaerolineales bacterium]